MRNVLTRLRPAFIEGLWMGAFILASTALATVVFVALLLCGVSKNDAQLVSFVSAAALMVWGQLWLYRRSCKRRQQEGK